MKTHLIKTVSKIALVLVPAMTLSLTATAHDPKLHVKKAEKLITAKWITVKSKKLSKKRNRKIVITDMTIN